MLDQTRLPFEPGPPSTVQRCSTTSVKVAKPVSSLTSSYTPFFHWWEGSRVERLLEFFFFF